MHRLSLAALAAAMVLALTLWPSRHATAQVLPPERASITGSSAWGFSGTATPVYSIRFSTPIARDFDLAGSYHGVSLSGSTASLYGVGIRYHLALPIPKWDVWVSGGYAAIGGPVFVGLTGVTANSTGGFGGIGGSIRLTERYLGYASVSLVSLGGATNGAYDAGVQYRASRDLGIQVGYLGFGSTGGGYVGLTVRFPWDAREDPALWPAATAGVPGHRFAPGPRTGPWAPFRRPGHDRHYARLPG